MPTSLIRTRVSLRYSHLTSAIAVVILVAQSLFFVWDYIGINRNIEHEAAADGVLRNIRDVLDDLLDAETGQRGYLLTGNEHYLALYTAARARISRDLAQLATAPAPDNASYDNSQKIHLLAKRKLNELERTIELHRRGKVAESWPR